MKKKGVKTPRMPSGHGFTWQRITGRPLLDFPTPITDAYVISDRRVGPRHVSSQLSPTGFQQV